MAGGIDFTDGVQVSGEGAGAPFEGGQMSSGGPVECPWSADDKSTDVKMSGEMPPMSGNTIESPCDYQ